MFDQYQVGKQVTLVWEEWIKCLRNICNISIEEKRASKEIGSSLEADIEIKLNKRLFELSQHLDFSEFCITSKSSIKENIKDEVIVETKKAKGNKCPICWKITTESCSRTNCAANKS